MVLIRNTKRKNDNQIDKKFIINNCKLLLYYISKTSKNLFLYFQKINFYYYFIILNP